MEPQRKKQWTDPISDVVLCNYFYIFFIIFSVFAGLSLLAGIYMFTMSSKMSLPMLLALIFNTAITFGISCTSALFLYLICDRALKPKYEGYQSCEFEDMPQVEAESEGFYEENKQ
jgi:hypothetical protein